MTKVSVRRRSSLMLTGSAIVFTIGCTGLKDDAKASADAAQRDASSPASDAGDDAPPRDAGSAPPRDAGDASAGGTSGSGGAPSDGGTQPDAADSGGGIGANDSGPIGSPCDACDPLASCDPMQTQPGCSCPAGHDDPEGDGSRCVDRDECALGAHDCDPNAQCTNTAGSFSCECRGGWRGTGQSCADVDECALDSDGCDSAPDACVNTLGGFSCTCPGTHYGSGVGAGGCKLAAVTVEAGGVDPGFTCALLATHQVKCWGINGSGQLGYGDVRARGGQPGEMGNALPPLELGAGTPTAISAGGVHACARFDDGKAKCWGSNDVGALGLEHNDNVGDGPGEMGSALRTVMLDGSIVAIGAAASHTCAQVNTGGLKCWGSNIYGQLGYDDTTRRGDGPNEMDPVLSTVSLSAGVSGLARFGYAYHTCARLIGGGLKCWGAPGGGKLGQGPTTGNIGDQSGEMAMLQPIALGAGRYATAVATGYNHTCALLDDKSVKCWGQNATGTLGLGDTANRGDDANEMGDALPPVPLGGPAIAVTAGFVHSCAILESGAVKCWGYGAFGALGLGDTDVRGDVAGTTPDKLPAVDLGTGRTATQISAGPLHTCALLDNGGIKCWGSNAGGELGIGDTQPRGDGPGEMGDALPYVDLGG